MTMRRPANVSMRPCLAQIFPERHGTAEGLAIWARSRESLDHVAPELPLGFARACVLADGNRRSVLCNFAYCEALVQ